jgi:hypothetical protein
VEELQNIVLAVGSLLLTNSIHGEGIGLKFCTEEFSLKSADALKVWLIQTTLEDLYLLMIAGSEQLA